MYYIYKTYRKQTIIPFFSVPFEVGSGIVVVVRELFVKILIYKEQEEKSF